MRKLPVFHDRLKAFSATMDKTDLESGNKSNPILKLSNITSFCPNKTHKKTNTIPHKGVFFHLRVPEKNRETYCEVREFVATEKTCILPWWMMNNLLLTEGEHVKIEIATLPKGTAVEIQPFKHKFSQTNITKEEYTFTT
jgi:hypothetical protein